MGLCPDDTRGEETGSGGSGEYEPHERGDAVGHGHCDLREPAMSASHSFDALATCGDGTPADEASPALDGGTLGAVRPSDLDSVRTRTLRLRALLVGLDLVGAAVPWALVLVLAGHGPWLARLGLVVVFVVISLLLIGVQDLYLARACAIRAVEVGGLARAAIGCGLVGVVVAEIGGVGPTRLGAATAALATFTSQAVLRGCYGAWLRTKRTHGHYSRRVCVLGLEDEADALVELIGAHPEMGYQVVAVVSATAVSGLPGGDSDIVAHVRASGASGVLIASSGFASMDLNRVIKQLLASGVHVQLSTGLTRIGHRRVRVSPVSHEPLLYLEPISLAGWQRAAKRCMDVVVGSAMLVASLPVLGLAALAIKLDDGGPLIFRQERVSDAAAGPSGCSSCARWSSMPRASSNRFASAMSGPAHSSRSRTIPGSLGRGHSSVAWVSTNCHSS